MIRPFFDYAAPVVFPNFSSTSIEKLQKVQNKCLRLITGCHFNSAIDHLHSETQILPVREHLKLLSSQYLVRALNPNHPSHPHVVEPPPPSQRQMKETLRSKCWSAVENFLQDGIIRPEKVKEAMKSIHIQIVSDTVDAFNPNRVLGTIPPLIHPSE